MSTDYEALSNEYERGYADGRAAQDVAGRTHNLTRLGRDHRHDNDGLDHASAPHRHVDGTIEWRQPVTPPPDALREALKKYETLAQRLHAAAFYDPSMATRKWEDRLNADWVAARSLAEAALRAQGVVQSLLSVPAPTLTQERIAAALDSEKVADMMGGGFESGEITMLSRYLAEALRDAV